MGPEDTYAERPALKVLKSFGYDILSPKKVFDMRGTENRVLLRPVLIEAIKRLNKLTDADADAVANDLANLDDNEEWLRTLRGDGRLSSRKSAETGKHGKIDLIDYLNPDNNVFHVTNQFRVQTQSPRIADVVVFVNGIPLVVVEAKSPLKADGKMRSAHEQIEQYRRDIPRLFAMNAFNIVTDGVETLYGATGAPMQYFGTWRDAWPKAREDFPDDLTKDLWCLLEPSRLLDLVAHFIVFEEDPETKLKIKKICRYQQFRAVNKAVERVASGKGLKGLIWHTQGSGKSLTMVFLALKFKTHRTIKAKALENPNLLVLTDRKDLDDQIAGTFHACGLPNPEQMSAVKDLHEKVKSAAGGAVVLSTIFKFQGSKNPVANSDDWIVMVDECHRTQEKDLGAFLQATLPDARYFGFTGTPIKSNDHDTYARFSAPGEGYLDKYGIDDAVRDGATVPILYEGRKTEWSVDEEKLDILFDRWFAELSDDQLQALKDKGLTLATVAKHPDRMRQIAMDIWEHFKTFAMPDGYKAQVVGIDREAVILYRDTLAAVIAADLAKDGLSTDEAATKADTMIACVYSSAQDDSKPSEDPNVTALREKLKAHYLDTQGEKDAKAAFKKRGSDPQFLIVCDKLLTGFDAPIEAVMYLDKPLKEHNLLQAIARVNRTSAFKGEDGAEIEKPHGRIVDYIGITKKLDEALASYRADDVQNAMQGIDTLRADLKEAFARFDKKRRELGLSRLDAKAAAYAVEKMTREDREDDWFDIQMLTRRFIRAYADLSPDPLILEYQKDLKWADAFLRIAQQIINKAESIDHKSYSGKIRQMLEENVRATGLITTIKLRSITDPEFAGDFETTGKSEEEIKEAFIRKSSELRRVTSELADKNLAQYQKFSERVIDLIRRFEEGQIAAAEGLDAYQDLTDKINAEKNAHKLLKMTERGLAILRILQHHLEQEDVSEDAMREAAIRTDAIYGDAERLQPSWYFMDAYRRDLMRDVRRTCSDLKLPKATTIREAIDEYASNAYRGGV